MKRVVLPLLALAALASPAAGQDTDLSEADVRAFFSDLAPRAEKAVANGDWQGIRGWMQTHVADEASIALSGTFVATEGPTMTYNAVMNGRDLKRASALSMSAMGPQMMASGAIGDYEAGTEVASVTELPNGLASAEVRFTEHGMLDLRALAGATGGSDGGEAAIPAEGLEPLIFTSAAECTFRLSRENGEIVIILAACRTDTTM